MSLVTSVERRRNDLRGIQSKYKIPDTVVSALPNMSPEKLKSMVETYGKDKILAAVKNRIETNRLEGMKLNLESKGLHKKISALEWGILANKAAQATYDTISGGRGVTQAMQESGWKHFLKNKSALKGGVSAASSSGSEMHKNRTDRIMLKAVGSSSPLDVTVMAAGETVDYTLRDLSGAATAKQMQNLQRVSILNLQTRGLSNVKTQLESPASITQPLAAASWQASSIPIKRYETPNFKKAPSVDLSSASIATPYSDNINSCISIRTIS